MRLSVFPAILLIACAMSMKASTRSDKTENSQTNSSSKKTHLVQAGLFHALDILTRDLLPANAISPLRASLAVARYCGVLVAADRLACRYIADSRKPATVLPTVIRAVTAAAIDPCGSAPLSVSTAAQLVLLGEGVIALLEHWKVENRMARFGKRMHNRWHNIEEELCETVNGELPEHLKEV